MHEDGEGDHGVSEEQKKYSPKIDAGNEIPGVEIKNSTSVNLKEPTILVVLGLFLQIFNVYVGLGLIIAGFIWVFWRLISRIIK
jgi:hypothetical protein